MKYFIQVNVMKFNIVTHARFAGHLGCIDTTDPQSYDHRSRKSCDHRSHRLLWLPPSYQGNVSEWILDRGYIRCVQNPRLVWTAIPTDTIGLFYIALCEPMYDLRYLQMWKYDSGTSYICQSDNGLFVSLDDSPNWKYIIATTDIRRADAWVWFQPIIRPIISNPNDNTFPEILHRTDGSHSIPQHTSLIGSRIEVWSPFEPRSDHTRRILETLTITSFTVTNGLYTFSYNYTSDSNYETKDTLTLLTWHVRKGWRWGLDTIDIVTIKNDDKYNKYDDTRDGNPKSIDTKSKPKSSHGHTLAHLRPFCSPWKRILSIGNSHDNDHTCLTWIPDKQTVEFVTPNVHLNSCQLWMVDHGRSTFVLVQDDNSVIEVSRKTLDSYKLWIPSEEYQSTVVPGVLVPCHQPCHSIPDYFPYFGKIQLYSAGHRVWLIPSDKHVFTIQNSIANSANPKNVQNLHANSANPKDFQEPPSNEVNTWIIVPWSSIRDNRFAMKYGTRYVQWYRHRWTWTNYEHEATWWIIDSIPSQDRYTSLHDPGMCCMMTSDRKWILTVTDNDVTCVPNRVSSCVPNRVSSCVPNQVSSCVPNRTTPFESLSVNPKDFHHLWIIHSEYTDISASTSLLQSADQANDWINEHYYTSIVTVTLLCISVLFAASRAWNKQDKLDRE
jgi:hypothetical protein